MVVCNDTWMTPIGFKGHGVGDIHVLQTSLTLLQLRHRVLAAQLCGLFVEVEGARFELRVQDVLPLIEQQLEPGKYGQVGYCIDITLPSTSCFKSFHLFLILDKN